MCGVLVIAKTDLKPAPNVPIELTSSFFVDEPTVVIEATSLQYQIIFHHCVLLHR